MPQDLNASHTLIQVTVRLEPVVAAALRERAGKLGQEPADYATGVLTGAVLDLIAETDEAGAQRLRAELEIKTRAVELARRLSPAEAFDPNVTLKVFQAIRGDGELSRLYLSAIGNRPGDERGNPLKARLNRSLGALIKTAVGADVETIDGQHPVKVQVSGEFIFSYTLLRPGSPPARAAA